MNSPRGFNRPNDKILNLNFPCLMENLIFENNRAEKQNAVKTLVWINLLKIGLK